MNMWAIIGAGLATIIALIVATFLVAGAEQFWRLFGEPDLGPVSFEQLERRANPPMTRLPVLRISARARVDVTDAALSGHRSRTAACVREGDCL